MSRRPALPVSLHVSGLRILVVGDGNAASERLRRLEHAGAEAEHVARADYRAELCAGAAIVFACGDDRAHDRTVAADARAAGCLVYAQDQPALSDFAMPAVARRGPLAIAISTDAAAPALSRRMREELDALLARSGEALDMLIAELERRRDAMEPGTRRSEELYALAARLRIAGDLAIAGDD